MAARVARAVAADITMRGADGREYNGREYSGIDEFSLTCEKPPMLVHRQ
jgi:hypothetical protein